jgi:hypothetical protein
MSFDHGASADTWKKAWQFLFSTQLLSYIFGGKTIVFEQP